ncbi:het domain-containing protein [Pochonia chlamydosporia 170]|uniref:Het domain-containing protein n=1 Tax=Pochonia chlamydosporia 170 TaxID=1380566 RepID=A0A179F5S5_METCM|nr:het domain-containing protein [Pochonia chlamydosporia 170]OAQ60523.1 het domain-containing protein [Pochonia chlamydosporia 170]
MRLINVKTLEIEIFAESTVPDYAILSHTWEDEEVSYQDMSQPGASEKQGFRKLQQACRLASEQQLGYVWADTCCIDKTSSAELSEAINSMFHWYRSAVVCFVYLSDLSSLDHDQGPNYEDLKSCRWFTRGWTLQELIAPATIQFYDKNWTCVGTKQTLDDPLHLITKIDKNVLQDGRRITQFSVAKKMTWASGRQTTRIEDMAYCLLGILDVNMPLLYGEREKAFQRLQEEIVRSTHDMTIFSWKTEDTSVLYSGLFATSPSQFIVHPNMEHFSSTANQEQAEFSVTNKGIKLSSRLVKSPESPLHYILPLPPFDSGPFTKITGIYLQQYSANSFVRANPHRLYESRMGLRPLVTQERVLYALKAVDDNLHESISAPSSFLIDFQLDNHMQIRKVVPDSLWDRHHRRRLFVPPSGSRQAVVFVEIGPRENTPAFSVQRLRTQRRMNCMLLLSFVDGATVSCDYVLLDKSRHGELFIQNVESLTEARSILMFSWKGKDDFRVNMCEEREWSLGKRRFETSLGPGEDTRSPLILRLFERVSRGGPGTCFCM